MTEPMLAIESSLQRLKSARRSAGTFSTWAIASMGSGTAKRGTRSKVPAGMSSSSRSTMARTGATTSASRFGVKYAATVPRNRV